MSDDDEAPADPTEDDDEELVQVNHLVPKSDKNQAQRNADEWGELSEAVRAVYRLYARRGNFGDIGELEVQLLKAKHDRERIQEQIDELTSQLSTIKSREEHLEEEIEEAKVRGNEYEDLLEDIEAEIRDGVSVFPDHGRIKEAAKMSGKSAGDVISDLRDRNPDLPDAAFTERRKSDEAWTGTNSGLSIDTDE